MALLQLPCANGRNAFCRAIRQFLIWKPLLDRILVKSVETGGVHQAQFHFLASADFQDSSFASKRATLTLCRHYGPEMNSASGVIQRSFQARPAIVIGIRVPRRIAVHHQLASAAFHAVGQGTVQRYIGLYVRCLDRDHNHRIRRRREVLRNERLPTFLAAHFRYRARDVQAPFIFAHLFRIKVLYA